MLVCCGWGKIAFVEIDHKRKEIMRVPLSISINNLRPQRVIWKVYVPLVFMLFLLSACATVSPPAAPAPITSRSLMETAEDKEDKLTNLPYEELIGRGNHHLAKGNSKLAQLHFQMALKKKNDSVAAYVGLGEVMALSGDNQSAHRLFDKALSLDVENRQALIATGNIYRRESNYAQAEFAFNRAMQIYPDDPEILTELAVTYGRMGAEDKAQPLLEQVVALKSQDASAYNNLGFNYLMQQNYVEAIKTLQQAVAIEPGSSRMQNNLAAAYAFNKQTDKAFKLFLKTGSEATASNDLGYLHMVMGMDDEAKDFFEKALELHPRHYVRAKENLLSLDSEP